MSGIRDYLKGGKVRKSLEPTKCGLCGGNHGKFELITACGDCMDGLANYMGGNNEFASLFGPHNKVTPESADTGEVTAGAAKTRGSAARADSLKGSGTDNPPAEPKAVGFKEPVRSGENIDRPEEPATHTSTNATRARS